MDCSSVCSRLFVLVLLAGVFSSCSRKYEPVLVPAPPQVGYLNGMITDGETTEPIEGALVHVFDADTKAPIGVSTTSDVEGNYKVTVGPGDYYIKVTKQGYFDVPPADIPALPFTITLADTTTDDVEMFKNSATDNGWISGTVSSSSDSHTGVLVVADDGTKGYSSVTDSNGYYVIYNVPAGTYDVQAWGAGFNSSTNSATTTAGSETADVDLSLTDDAGGSVSGQVSFLATGNIDVDVALTHEITGESIPGLSTTTSGGTYTINNVPNGTFLARASFANDTKVMDPDWIIKFGEPYVTVSGGAETRDFSVTGAITVLSPSNASTSTIPVEINNAAPTFEWDAYSSTSDYVIEVRDANGVLIWGGFSADWTVKNISIPSSETSVVFNSDGNATETLVVGKTYRWRVYASKDAQGGASWNLISASEEQMGLFKIVP